MIEFDNGILHLGSFITVTLAIIVLFVGKRINGSFRFLKEFSIPEPVTGGLIFSLIIALIHAAAGIEIEFELTARNFLLVYFFTTIGINASLRDLFRGGKPLLLLLIITVGYMFLQNLTGISVAAIFGLAAPIGMLGGSVSLTGGHGTAIAWAPLIAENYGIANAMEIGVACATFGLVLACMMGGPIAKLLINRHKLQPTSKEPLDVGVPDSGAGGRTHPHDFLDAILAIHVCVIVGMLLNKQLESLGLKLPLFVSCLFAGILITNLIPKKFPRISGTEWPSRKPAVALLADVSLGAFLTMSLMNMQLWTLVDLAGPILAILGTQFLVALAVTLLVVFPVMGKTYDAAVVCAGFGGISLGATPTAMANMSAVTQRYGASHLAFIIVPLVGAFFLDLANAFLIPFFLANF